MSSNRWSFVSLSLSHFVMLLAAAFVVWPVPGRIAAGSEKAKSSRDKLELCKSTMQSHGWTGKDVLPGVRIVVGAYPRIIDLQLRGYAYIRF